MQLLTLEQILKQHGQSITQVRQLVFKALQGQEPQTMSALIKRCSAVDKASVYRTVSLFERIAVVQRLQIGWKYTLELTDSFVHHHHHLTCSGCGRIKELPEDRELERGLLRLTHNQGFTMNGHQLEIQGLCSTCSDLLKAM